MKERLYVYVCVCARTHARARAYFYANLLCCCDTSAPLFVCLSFFLQKKTEEETILTTITVKTLFLNIYTYMSLSGGGMEALRSVGSDRIALADSSLENLN